MSCITVVGRIDRWGLDDKTKLPMTLPKWTDRKAQRLARMAKSETVALRAVAAGHPRTPRAALAILLRDDEIHVRRVAVKNPILSNKLLAVASKDSDPGIAAYARLLIAESVDA